MQKFTICLCIKEIIFKCITCTDLLKYQSYTYIDIWNFALTIDSCAKSPCMNGGTCFVRSPSTYKCMCKIRFIGKHCENEDLFNDIYYTMSVDDSIFPLQYQNKPQMPFPIFQPSNQLPFPRPKADK